jgi:hypothetical protein
MSTESREEMNRWWPTEDQITDLSKRGALELRLKEKPNRDDGRAVSHPATQDQPLNTLSRPLDPTSHV